MDDENLVQITVSRKAGTIEYKVDCLKEVTTEELAHFLDEIIVGICTWKPEVCEETAKSYRGTIKEKNKKKASKT